MTEEMPALSTELSVKESLVREHAFTQLCRSIVPENKRVLFETLAAHGIAAVIVQFDGCGDSGQIEDIEVQGPDRPAGLPIDSIEIANVSWDGLKISRKTMCVHEVIEHLAYDFLRETHRGWEDNEGAYGTFTFDVGKRTILLEFNERHMESDYSEHEF